jgi:hypothetical protein
MIEVRVNPEASMNRLFTTYLLVLDGVPLSSPQAASSIVLDVTGQDQLKLAFQIADARTWDTFCTHRFLDIPQEIEQVGTLTQLAGVSVRLRIEARAQRGAEGDGRAFVGTCEPELDLYRWSAPWQAVEFIEEYRSQAKNHVAVGMHLVGDEEDDWFGLTVRFPRPDPAEVMSDALSRWLPMLTDVLESTERALRARVDAGSFVMRFDFPPDLQGACERYLTYFAQFLRDFGVEAATALQHEGTTAVFSVTPESQGEALETVWRALSLYLQLPDAPGVDLAAYRSTDPQVQHLASMVQTYSSELTLARARTQAREAELLRQTLTIQDQGRMMEAQRALIDQQTRALDYANVLLESLRSVQKEGQEVAREEFLGGIVSLGRFEEKGVGIDLAKGVRLLRGLLSGRRDPEDRAGTGTQGSGG